MSKFALRNYITIYCLWLHNYQKLYLSMFIFYILTIFKLIKIHSVTFKNELFDIYSAIRYKINTI